MEPGGACERAEARTISKSVSVSISKQWGEQELKTEGGKGNRLLLPSSGLSLHLHLHLDRQGSSQDSILSSGLLRRGRVLSGLRAGVEQMNSCGGLDLTRLLRLDLTDLT